MLPRLPIRAMRPRMASTSARRIRCPPFRRCRASGRTGCCGWGPSHFGAHRRTSRAGWRSRSRVRITRRSASNAGRCAEPAQKRARVRAWCSTPGALFPGSRGRRRGWSPAARWRCPVAGAYRSRTAARRWSASRKVTSRCARRTYDPPAMLVGVGSSNEDQVEVRGKPSSFAAQLSVGDDDEFRHCNACRCFMAVAQASASVICQRSVGQLGELVGQTFHPSTGSPHPQAPRTRRV